MCVWRICRKPYRDTPLSIPPPLRRSKRWSACLCRSAGSSWLTSGRTAALNVLSAIITVERNFLLNPRHLEAQRIRIVSDEAFTFDTRLL
jgi:RES domain-containing protein